MRVISCQEPNVLIEKTEELTERSVGEVLIEIKRIGICGTDLHAYRGNQPFFTYPRVLGHELAGVVFEADTDSALTVGDQVTVIPYLECGTCIACRNGKPNCCTDMKVLGVHLDGGMKEIIRVPENHVLKVDQISLDEAAMVEPLSIGAHAVRRSNLSKDQVALVIGAGPIGLAVMRFAKLTGATVIAMDINHNRLEFCKSWAEVDYTINALEEPEAALAKITDGDFPQVVFDATGNKHSMMNAFNFVSHGGQLIYVGLVKEDISFHDPEFHKREMSLLASRNATIDDFKYVISCIEQKQVNINELITNRIPFARLVTDFETLFDPASKVIKGVIER
ncbi:zinc-binding alcohol dehydrogenase family protein [Halalkalibacter alkalisediminis]|uniref:Zinc-binding alcohol dehydrogenase family protein n=1 Tax=Halalkalibacter alkalisediminis TaxID=935616 RepID=A0ABV6NLK7_9BACI|nr:zinc-binding alcohol dehydrogenase family protein [Halalkalibacter alkalisediminis]